MLVTRKEVFDSLIPSILANVEVFINCPDDLGLSNEMILEKVKQIIKQNHRKSKKSFEDVNIVTVDRINSYRCLRELYIENRQLEWIKKDNSKEKVFHFHFVYLVGF